MRAPATQQTHPPFPLFIRRSQLKSLIGLSPSTVDRLEAEGLFPARRRVGAGVVGWLGTEVQEFFQKHAQKREV